MVKTNNANESQRMKGHEGRNPLSNMKEVADSDRGICCLLYLHKNILKMETPNSKPDKKLWRLKATVVVC